MSTSDTGQKLSDYAAATLLSVAITLAKLGGGSVKNHLCNLVRDEIAFRQKKEGQS